MNEANYRKVLQPINSSLYTVQNEQWKWGVVDEDENIIVPFGKYAWIDGFQNGLAKVIGHDDNTSPNHLNIDLENIGSWDDNDDNNANSTFEPRAEQGIIDEDGTEVLPLEYTVWKFYGKTFPNIKAFKNEIEYKFSYAELKSGSINDNDDDDDDDYYDDDFRNYSDDSDHDYLGDSWDAMTDGQYGDMPEGFDGDYSFLGY